MRITTPEQLQLEADNRRKNKVFKQWAQSVNPTPGYTMASPIRPGLGKVVEEAGEVLQIGGKIMAVQLTLTGRTCETNLPRK